MVGDATNIGYVNSQGSKNPSISDTGPGPMINRLTSSAMKLDENF